MVRILIDDKVCDLSSGFSVPESIFTFNAEHLADIESQRSGKKIAITIPSTPTNDAIVGFAADSYTAIRFNATYHEGVIEVNGTTMLKGVVHLEAVEYTPLTANARGCCVEYHISITDGAPQWINYMALSPLRNTPLKYQTTLDASAIVDSWSDESRVKFLPIYRDEYLNSKSQSSLHPPQRVLTIGDYHPFISVEGLLEAMFDDFGYSMEGEFIKSGLFKSLHMSGALGKSDSASAIKLNSMMGFCAGRRDEATTTANFAGRAYLSPLVLTNSLGNFVQTTDKELNGEFYNNGEALTIGEQGIIFTPNREVNAAFELYLKFSSTYKILSRYRLQGFDSIYVDAGCDISFGVLNPYADHRDEVSGGVTYRSIIFDYVAEDEYRIVWSLNSGGKIYSYITKRAASITTPTASIKSCHLEKKNASGAYVAAEEDWALYDGYVTEEVEREVEITIRTAPEKLSPSNPKDFSTIYLYGAKSGNQITLSSECTLRPIFTSELGYGSQVSGSKILQHSCTQTNLLAALQQMFNLRIFSDKERHKVLIEPRDDFYTDRIFDWSDRIILSEPIELSDMAADISKRRILAYKAEGGGAVNRFNNKHDTSLGEWSATTDSYIARDDVARTENLLFCPTLSQTEVSAEASAAALLSIGNRDADEVGDSAIRIVSYKGLFELPESQKWGFPANGNQYPFAAFHYPAGKVESDNAAIVGEVMAAGPTEPFTLCFEDRDGLQGLHSYYDRQWSAEAKRRKLSLSIRIDAEELMALLDTTSDGANIRSLFRIEVDGQPTLYRLHAVKGYDTAQGIAKMVFMQEDQTTTH